MVGDLFYDRADICASGLAMSLERQEVADFSFGFLRTMLTLTTRNPGFSQIEGKTDDEVGSVDSLSFLHIFALWGWIGVGMTGLICTVTYAVINMKYKNNIFCSNPFFQVQFLLQGLMCNQF